MPAKIVTLKLDSELIERLDVLADAQGLTRSQLMRGYLLGSVQQHEVLAKVMGDPVLARAYAELFSNPEIATRMAQATAAKLEPEQLQMFREQMDNVASAGAKKPGKTKAKR